MALPSAYQEVTYLESTGTQYINTGIIPTNMYGFKAKMAWTELSGDKSLSVTQNSNGRWGVGAYGSSWQVGAVCSPTGSGNVGSITVNKIYNVEYNYNGNLSFIVDGSTIKSSINKGSGTMTSLYIFAFNNSGSTIYQGKLKLYSYTIYNGTTKVGDFVPCYRKSDNKPGLYDTVNGKFYTNAGSGEFTVGLPIIRAGNVLVGGTAYSITGGRTLINGTAYSIDKGRTLVGGAGYNINFLPPIGTSLEATSWADIKKISDAGMGAAYWAIGDTKTVSVNGTNKTVRIIGFNQDVDQSGSSNTITFQFTSSIGSYRMDSSSQSTNKGWFNCELRTSTLPTIKATLPSDLRSVLKSVKKKTWYKTGNVINETVDDLFLLSATEFCTSNYWNYVKDGQGALYTFWSNNAPTLFGSEHWLRGTENGGNYWNFWYSTRVWGTGGNNSREIMPAFVV